MAAFEHFADQASGAPNLIDVGDGQRDLMQLDLLGEMLEPWRNKTRSPKRTRQVRIGI